MATPTLNRLAFTPRPPGVRPVLHAASLWRGAAARFEFALFDLSGEALQSSFTGISTVTFELYAGQNSDAGALLAKTVALNTEMTLAQWQAATHAHATVDLTAAETAVALPAGRGQHALWFTVYSSLAGGNRYVWGEGALTLVRSQSANDATPVDPDDLRPTFAEMEAAIEAALEGFTPGDVTGLAIESHDAKNWKFVVEDTTYYMPKLTTPIP